MSWRKGSFACIALLFRSRRVTVETRVKSGTVEEEGKTPRRERHRQESFHHGQKEIFGTHRSSRPPHRCNGGPEAQMSPCQLCSGSISSARGVSMTAFPSTKAAFADLTVIPLRASILCCAVAVLGLLPRRSLVNRLRLRFPTC